MAKETSIRFTVLNFASDSNLITNDKFDYTCKKNLHVCHQSTKISFVDQKSDLPTINSTLNPLIRTCKEEHLLTSTTKVYFNFRDGKRKGK